MLNNSVYLVNNKKRLSERIAAFVFTHTLAPKKTRVTESNARHNLGYLKGKIFVNFYFFQKKQLLNHRVKKNNIKIKKSKQILFENQFQYSKEVKNICFCK
ncbi:hypothetical protein BV902_23440 [Sphingobacterium sp. B29]|nr:hypothetical protein BV902_23440 [Sphingobacterium sp. B29]